ncbi:hypothetical protein P691DRAFT_809375 [Macrolepiota fuliginosa MF-IS2]|uniref:Pyridoxamine 5'-phosphate oxidase N-terminal domain-containing protein n=1 Tax=Macrolepiota fuliginosa MF-IS2 TaxID=1400762 RepID=A0A9P5XIA6_9AGAR|nr:hypothetical protein P691DRAFT_809375 [Macrolepiota fuliginosa MF-IS2]
MVKFFEEIPDFLIPWINEQKMFCVATAPLTPNGHVNVSPKGADGTFHIVNSKQVWYEDLTGSGIETIAHLRENRRITVLFTAFDGPPRICRIFGKGTVYEFDTPEYNALLPPEKRQPGSRSIIMVDIYKVGTSCGYAIPFYKFEGHRMKLHAWAVQKQNADIAAEEEAWGGREPSQVEEDPVPAAEGGLRRYWKDSNSKSLDGIPGLRYAPHSRARFSYIDPKATHEDRPSRSAPQWINSQTVAAFALGAMVAKVLQQQGFW